MNDSPNVTLPELRKMRKMTQLAVSKNMGISQPSVQKVENQKDMQISTLDRYIRAIGGTLELHVIIDNQRLVLEMNNEQVS